MSGSMIPLSPDVPVDVSVIFYVIIIKVFFLQYYEQMPKSSNCEQKIFYKHITYDNSPVTITSSVNPSELWKKQQM